MRCVGGTLGMYRPDQGGIDAIVALLPPAITFFALVYAYGF